MLDPFLLTILACPQCRGPIRLDPEGRGVACDRCRLLFEVRDEIPIMLADAARKLPEPAGRPNPDEENR